jgi:hypothetical protein
MEKQNIYWRFYSQLKAKQKVDDDMSVGNKNEHT